MAQMERTLCWRECNMVFLHSLKARRLLLWLPYQGVTAALNRYQARGAYLILNGLTS